MGKYDCIVMPKTSIILALFSGMAKIFDISWEHVKTLYERDKGKATGLAVVPKLKFEHINLTPFAKMRVDLAAQVCSCILCTTCTCMLIIEYILAGAE